MFSAKCKLPSFGSAFCQKPVKKACEWTEKFPQRRQRGLFDYNSFIEQNDKRERDESEKKKAEDFHAGMIGIKIMI